MASTWSQVTRKQPERAAANRYASVDSRYRGLIGFHLYNSITSMSVSEFDVGEHEARSLEIVRQNSKLRSDLHPILDKEHVAWS